MKINGNSNIILWEQSEQKFSHYIMQAILSTALLLESSEHRHFGKNVMLPGSWGNILQFQAPQGNPVHWVYFSEGEYYILHIISCLLKSNFLKSLKKKKKAKLKVSYRFTDATVACPVSTTLSAVPVAIATQP